MAGGAERAPRGTAARQAGRGAEPAAHSCPVRSLPLRKPRSSTPPIPVRAPGRCGPAAPGAAGRAPGAGAGVAPPGGRAQQRGRGGGAGGGEAARGRGSLPPAFIVTGAGPRGGGSGAGRTPSARRPPLRALPGRLGEEISPPPCPGLPPPPPPFARRERCAESGGGDGGPSPGDGAGWSRNARRDGVVRGEHHQVSRGQGTREPRRAGAARAPIRDATAPAAGSSPAWGWRNGRKAVACAGCRLSPLPVPAGAAPWFPVCSNIGYGGPKPSAGTWQAEQAPGERGTWQRCRRGGSAGKALPGGFACGPGPGVFVAVCKAASYHGSRRMDCGPAAHTGAREPGDTIVRSHSRRQSGGIPSVKLGASVLASCPTSSPPLAE